MTRLFVQPKDTRIFIGVLRQREREADSPLPPSVVTSKGPSTRRSTVSLNRSLVELFSFPLPQLRDLLFI